MSGKISFGSAVVEEMVPLHKPSFSLRNLVLLGVLGASSTIGTVAIYHVYKPAVENIERKNNIERRNSFVIPKKVDGVPKIISEESSLKKDKITQESNQVNQEWNEKCTKSESQKTHKELCENLKQQIQNLQTKFAQVLK